MSEEAAGPTLSAVPGWLTLIIWSLLGRVSGPVFDQETSGWSYMGFWRSLRGGCLPLMMLLLLVTAAGCTLPVALVTLSETMLWVERLMILSIVLLVAVLLTGEMIKLIAGLLATALGATVIASEIEGGRLNMLRVTLLTPRQIVAGKFAAVLHELRWPFRMVVLARLIVLVGGISLVISALIYGMIGAAEVAQSVAPTAPLTPELLTPPVTPEPAVNPLSVVLVIVDIVLSLVLVLTWLVYWLAEPLLSAALFTAMGVFGSSLARTRSSGLITSLALRMGFWVLTYMISQVFGLLAMTALGPLMALSTVTELNWLTTLISRPELLALIYLLTVFASLLFGIAWTLGLAWVLLSATERRVEMLPYGR